MSTTFRNNKISVEIGEDYVRIKDHAGEQIELFYWTKEEWIEDPTLVPTICFAVASALFEREKILSLHKKTRE